MKRQRIIRQRRQADIGWMNGRPVNGSGAIRRLDVGSIIEIP